MKTILAIIGGIWIVGRLSRRSPNHPINSLGFQIQLGVAARNVSPVALATDPSVEMNYPYLGPGQETAQIQSCDGFVVGEGGGE